jgi:hypothetical protein
MPSLQIRHLPDHLYDALCQAAKAEHRSLTQQAIVQLERSFAVFSPRQARRHEILDALVTQPPLDWTAAPDPADVVRADRQRQ